jgi:hypothetical protein
MKRHSPSSAGGEAKHAKIGQNCDRKRQRTQTEQLPLDLRRPKGSPFGLACGSAAGVALSILAGLSLQHVLVGTRQRLYGCADDQAAFRGRDRPDGARAGLLGRSGSITRHSKSVRSYRLMIC